MTRTKKRGKKLKDQGSLMNSPHKKIRKGSKKNKKKRSKMDALSASVEDPPSMTMLVPVITPTVVATTSTVAHDNIAEHGKKKEKENIEEIPGFIFMCNHLTKPECYRNRVFGLPKGQVELVEKIKPGAKLFLFDFDSKLLYGVYNATSKGDLGLEPTAFNGKFPAQVKFDIFKECLPLTEKAFKHAIKDNYQGSKFRQDLTTNQVKTLIALFRPITARSAPTSVTAAPTLTNVVTRHTFPVPVMEARFQLPARPPPADNSYLHGVRYGNALPPPVFQSEQVITRLPYDQQQSGPYLGLGQPPIGPRHIIQQAVPPHCIGSYYSMEAHQPYLPENPSLSAQDPYARYGAAQEVVQTDGVTGYASEVVQRSENIAEQRDLLLSYLLHYPMTATSHHLQNFTPPHTGGHPLHLERGWSDSNGYQVGTVLNVLTQSNNPVRWGKPI